MSEHNNGNWTAARFRSFVVGALRAAWQRWPPKNEVKKAARVRRGEYRCAGYNRRSHIVPASLPPKPGNKNRVKNAVVDHINPVVCPDEGWVSYDVFVSRLFCEAKNLQVLCDECHLNKTREEKERRMNAKNSK